MTISPNNLKAHQSYLLERISSVLAGFFVLLVVLYIIVRNEPFVDQNIAVLTRIVLSLSIAVFGATIPGFLHVEWSTTGILIRAGGALALFVIAYFGTPKVFESKFPPAVDVSQLEEVLLHDAGKVYFLQVDDKRNKDFSIKPSSRAKDLASKIPNFSDSYALGLKAIAESEFDKANNFLRTAENEKLARPSKIYISLGELGWFKKDYENAILWYEKALEIESKNYQLINNMAVALLYNKKDYQRAIQYLTIAAENGLTISQAYLSQIYGIGLFGVTTDKNKALSILKSAKEKEDPHALFIASTMEENVSTKIEYLNEAAEKDHVIAQYLLGLIYKGEKKGYNLQPDYNKARSWMERAAQNGSLSAILNISEIYSDNRFGMPDLKKAAYYLEKGVNENYPPAISLLASWYLEGFYYPVDQEKALTLICRAVDMGYANGFYLLSGYYRKKSNSINVRSRGDARDAMEYGSLSYLCTVKAMQMGDPTAIKELDKRKPSEYYIKEAEEKCKCWPGLYNTH